MEAGMNDVLPKPFTKEGLLQLLEKHLAHLKKIPEGMEAITPHLRSSMPQSSTTQSLKDESSPNQSPSTISNWQSPGGPFSAISPTHAVVSNQFMQSMQPTPPYGMEQSPLQYQPPQTPLSAPRPSQHRRQISELIGADELGGDVKRQRIFTQPNPLALNPLQRSR